MDDALRERRLRHGRKSCPASSFAAGNENKEHRCVTDARLSSAPFEFACIEPAPDEVINRSKSMVVRHQLFGA